MTLQGIPVQAQQAGKISGVLKDGQGKPIPGIRMAAVAKTETLDEAITSPSMSSLAETDEQGRYTLDGIPPGRYFIAAGRLDVQTYYPGTADLAKAKDVVITPGLAITGMDFALEDTSFGRASTSFSTGSSASIPLRVTVEGGLKMPISVNGKFVAVKLEMAGVITAPITNATVLVPGPQSAAYRVTVENLPETYAVKSLQYGTTDLLTNTLRLTPANFGVGQFTILLPGAPAATPTSVLYVALAAVPAKTPSGIRVSGQLSVKGNRTVYVSGTPGTVYSDGSFEVYGVPPGRHLIVTRDNPTGLKALAASVVVGNSNLDGIVLEDTALLPIRAWELAPPKPAGDRPVGIVPLAHVKGSLVEESSRKPVPEGTVVIRTNGYSTTSFPVDDQGRFELPALLPGTYDLEVQIFGHSNIKQSIEIDDKDMKLELITRKLY